MDVANEDTCTLGYFYILRVFAQQNPPWHLSHQAQPLKNCRRRPEFGVGTSGPIPSFISLTLLSMFRKTLLSLVFLAIVQAKLVDVSKSSSTAKDILKTTNFE